MRTKILLCGGKYVVCINALKFSVGSFHWEHLYIAKEHINLRLFCILPAKTSNESLLYFYKHFISCLEAYICCWTYFLLKSVISFKEKKKKFPIDILRMKFHLCYVAHQTNGSNSSVLMLGICRVRQLLPHFFGILHVREYILAGCAAHQTKTLSKRM